MASEDAVRHISAGSDSYFVVGNSNIDSLDDSVMLVPICGHCGIQNFLFFVDEVYSVTVEESHLIDV